MTKAKAGGGRQRRWSLTPLGWELALHGDGSTRLGGLKVARVLVLRIARVRGIAGLIRQDIDDLALDAAMVAAARHDPARGAFSTILFQAVRSALYWWQAYRIAGKRSRRTVGLEAVEPKPWAVHPGFAAVEARDEVRHLCRRVPARLRRAARMRFGEGLELRQIGRALRVTTNRAWQMSNKALVVLRQAAGVA